jgi:glutamate dehydrogenase/leucine dehydrogenase
MTIAYQKKALVEAGLWSNYDWFMIKTTPSSRAWGEWAAKNNVKVVEVPVGFKEIASILRKVECKLRNDPGRDIIITDIHGNDINLGNNPRLLFGGEESGGEIFGPAELIKSANGRLALAMREKSAGEAMVVTSALAAHAESRNKTLSAYLEEIFEENQIISRFDYRADVIYFNPNEKDPKKLLQEIEEGLKTRTKNDTYFLSIALAIREGLITIDQAGLILKEAFEDLDFSKLENILFVGDGTYLVFSDKWVEIRPSGTEAKNKGYAGGLELADCVNYSERLANYSGERNPLHRQFIVDDFYSRIKDSANMIYQGFVQKDADPQAFQPPVNTAYLHQCVSPRDRAEKGRNQGKVDALIQYLGGLDTLVKKGFTGWLEHRAIIPGIIQLINDLSPRDKDSINYLIIKRNPIFIALDNWPENFGAANAMHYEIIRPKSKRAQPEIIERPVIIFNDNVTPAAIAHELRAVLFPVSHDENVRMEGISGDFSLMGSDGEDVRSRVMHVLRHFREEGFIFSPPLDRSQNGSDNIFKVSSEASEDEAQELACLNAMAKDQGEESVIVDLMGKSRLREHLLWVIYAQRKKFDTRGVSVDEQWADRFVSYVLSEIKDTVLNADYVRFYNLQYDLARILDMMDIEDLKNNEDFVVRGIFGLLSKAYRDYDLANKDFSLDLERLTRETEALRGKDYVLDEKLSPIIDLLKSLSQGCISGSGNILSNLEHHAGDAYQVLFCQQHSEEHAQLIAPVREGISRLKEFVAKNSAVANTIGYLNGRVLNSLLKSIFTSNDQAFAEKILDRLFNIRFVNLHLDMFFEIISMNPQLTSRIITHLLVNIRIYGRSPSENSAGDAFLLTDLINSQSRYHHRLVRLLFLTMSEGLYGQARVPTNDALRERTRTGIHGYGLTGYLRGAIHDDLSVHCVALLERTLEYWRTQDKTRLTDHGYQVDAYKGFKNPIHNYAFPLEVAEVHMKGEASDPQKARMFELLYELLRTSVQGETDLERLRNASDSQLESAYQKINEQLGTHLSTAPSVANVTDYIWAYREVSDRYNIGDISTVMRNIFGVRHYSSVIMSDVFGKYDFAETDLFRHVREGRYFEALDEISKARVAMKKILSVDPGYDKDYLIEQYQNEYGRDDIGNADGGAYVRDRLLGIYYLDAYMESLEERLISGLLADKFKAIDESNIIEALQMVLLMIRLNVGKSCVSLSQLDNAAFLLADDTNYTRLRDLLEDIIRDADDTNQYLRRLFADPIKKAVKLLDKAELARFGSSIKSDDLAEQSPQVRETKVIDSAMDYFTRTEYTNRVLIKFAERAKKFVEKAIEEKKLREAKATRPREYYLYPDYDPKRPDARLDHFYFVGKHTDSAYIRKMISDLGRGLLGAKVIGLFRACALDFTVPPLAVFPIGMQDTVMALYQHAAVEEIEKYIRQYKKDGYYGGIFGDKRNPMLVSVRSGAYFTMPGQMATVTNVGLTREIAQALIDRLTENGMVNEVAGWTGWDSYRRFLEEYAIAVLGLPHVLFEGILRHYLRDQGKKKSEELDSRQMRELALFYEGTITGKMGEAAIPQDPYLQLSKVIDAVKRSWDKTEKYRKEVGIAGDWGSGTAVIIQAMVYGNIKVDSGTGVAYTRNPNTGEYKMRLKGDFQKGAQGTDVVSSFNNPDHIERYKGQTWYEELKSFVQTLDREYYGSIFSLEYTVQNGKLFILQLKDIYMPLEAKRFLVSPAREDIEARGMPTSGGAYRGAVVYFDKKLLTEEKLAREFKKAKDWEVDGLILVLDEADPSEIAEVILKKMVIDGKEVLPIGAIVSKRGGFGSHTADIVRSANMTAVVGVSELEFNEQGGALLCNIPLTEGTILSIDGYRHTGIISRNIYPVTVTELISRKQPDIFFVAQIVNGINDQKRIDEVVRELEDFIAQCDDPADKRGAYIFLSRIYSKNMLAVLGPEMEGEIPSDILQLIGESRCEEAAARLKEEIAVDVNNISLYQKIAAVYRSLSMKMRREVLSSRAQRGMDRSQNNEDGRLVDEYIEKFGGIENFLRQELHGKALWRIIEAPVKQLAAEFGVDEAEINFMIESRGIHFARAPDGWDIGSAIGFNRYHEPVIIFDHSVFDFPENTHSQFIIRHELRAALLSTSHEENLSLDGKYLKDRDSFDSLALNLRARISAALVMHSFGHVLDRRIGHITRDSFQPKAESVPSGQAASVLKRTLGILVLIAGGIALAAFAHPAAFFMAGLLGMAVEENISSTFGIPENAKDSALAEKLRALNQISKMAGSQELIRAVLADPQLQQEISGLIRKQDRLENTEGFSVNWQWAEDFKERVLSQAVENLQGRDIWVLQMEYELSEKFLKAFEEYLIDVWGCSIEEARYNTGEVAKIIMAGGLGSFKPDLVRGWYQALSKFWGEIEASKRIHVMGVLYANAIKGKLEDAGRIMPRGPVLYRRELYEKYNIDPAEGLIGILKHCLEPVKTYHINLDIDVHEGQHIHHIGPVKVELYRNRFQRDSELREYWMYCPEIFNEAYPGDSDDDWRAVQTLLYRKVLLQFIIDSHKKGHIGENLLFSTSEVNTTLAIPAVIKDEYNPDILALRTDELSSNEKVALRLFKDLPVHHYNHTIVPAGLPVYHAYMFNRLQIADKFRSAVHNGVVDLVRLTAMVSDLITGCSSAHTRILETDPLLFKDVAHKVTEDPLFGNSEGSDVERWQGKPIRLLIRRYIERLAQKVANTRDIDISTYPGLFSFFDASDNSRKSFIKSILAAKKAQKRHLIDELFKETFGQINQQLKDEGEAAKQKLMEMPFFSFVRRMVPYKCGNLILDIIAGYTDLQSSRVIVDKLAGNPGFRQRIVNAGAVLLIGGRRFCGFGDRLKARAEELLRKYPELRYHVIFVSNHNVHTSWMIQQGTDFGGMLSFKDKEAGPTSFGNAQQNGSPTFATADGVIPERLKPVVRDAQGLVLGGTGYLVEYENIPCIDGDTRAETIPDIGSLVSKLEEAVADYRNRDNYGQIAYNALKMGLTQGDIRNQAKGLICVWADLIKKKTHLRDNAAFSSGKDASSIIQFHEKTIQDVVAVFSERNKNMFLGSFPMVDKEIDEVRGIFNVNGLGYISRYSQNAHFVRGPPELFQVMEASIKSRTGFNISIDAFNFVNIDGGIWIVIKPGLTVSRLKQAIAHEMGAIFGISHLYNFSILENMALGRDFNHSQFYHTFEDMADISRFRWERGELIIICDNCASEAQQGMGNTGRDLAPLQDTQDNLLPSVAGDRAQARESLASEAQQGMGNTGRDLAPLQDTQDNLLPSVAGGEDSSSCSGALNIIEKPLANIPQDEIRNILVFADFKTLIISELEEETITLWPLVAGFMQKFPSAAIHLSSDLPDIFRARQFSDKVQLIPSPQQIRELCAKDNRSFEVEMRTVLYDYKIDMVVDIVNIGRETGNFSWLSASDKPVDSKVPYAVRLFAPLANIAPLSPKLMSPSLMAYYNPTFLDRRNGRLYSVAVMKELLEKVANRSAVIKDAGYEFSLKPAGAWFLPIETYNLLGLDIAVDNLPTIQYGIEDSITALDWMKRLFDGCNTDGSLGAFDPNKKVVIINLYAADISKRKLLEPEEWMGVIIALARDIKDAYLVFTCGWGRQEDGCNDYLQKVVEGAKKEMANRKVDAKSVIIVPKKEGIQPFIHNILGIASIVLAQDACFSHLANGVYGIPVTSITAPNILHFSPPRKNAHSIILPSEFLRSPLEDKVNRGQAAYEEKIMSLKSGILGFIKMVNLHPERQEAKAAKACALSPFQRAILDRQLLNNTFFSESVDTTPLLNYIKSCVGALAESTDEVPLPEIMIVDTAAQLNSIYPRFKAKLFTSEEGKVYLFIDKSALEKIDSRWAVKEDVAGFEIIHEVIGHMWARSIFKDFAAMHPADSAKHDEKTLLKSRIREEAVAWVIAMLFIQRLAASNFGPNLVSNITRNKIASMGIDLARPDIQSYTQAVLQHVKARNDDLSAYRYVKMLEKHETSIRASLEKDYLPAVAEMFSLPKPETLSKAIGKVGMLLFIFGAAAIVALTHPASLFALGVLGMVSTISIPEGGSMFNNVVRQINAAAKKMGLYPEIREALTEPKHFKEARMDIPVEVGGKTVHLIGFRIVTNDARGAAKGGIRFDNVKALDELSDEELAGVIAHILDEDRALSSWMTLKNAVALIPYGGGKGCVGVPLSIVPKNEKGEEIAGAIHAAIIREYVRRAWEQNKYLFGPYFDVPAPDMRTKGVIMAWFLDEHLRLKTELGLLPEPFLSELKKLLDANYEETQTPFYNRYLELGGTEELGTITGKPVKKVDPVTKEEILMGGSLGREAATGQGVVFATIEALKAFGEKLGIGTQLKGQSIAVQGMGNVGGFAALIFHKEGACVGGVSDFPGLIYDRRGINIPDLFERVKRDGMLKAYQETPGFVAADKSVIIRDNGDLEIVPEGTPGSVKAIKAILELPLNIGVPAYREKQITAENAGRIRFKMMVEGANGPTTPEADEKLEYIPFEKHVVDGQVLSTFSLAIEKGQSGVLIVPDILANIGGVVVSYFEWLQNLKGEHWSEIAVNKMLEQRMSVSCRDVFAAAEFYKVSLRMAATILALERVSAAMYAADNPLRDRMQKEGALPYEGYDLLEHYETIEELNLICSSGRYQELVDRCEAQIDREITHLAERVLKELPANTRRFVAISGPTAVGKLNFANRMMEALRSMHKEPGLKTYCIDIEEDSVALFELISRMDENSILFMYGDYALDDKILALFPAQRTLPIFLNTAPSLKLADNKPFTSADLRFLRLILELTSKGSSVLEVVKAWTNLRDHQIKPLMPR